MEINITDSKLEITQKNRIWGSLIVLIISAVFLWQLYYVVTHLPKFKISFWSVFWLTIIEVFFSVLIVRVIYFRAIDNDSHILKNDECFTINGIIYPKANIKAIYITEYGNRIMSNNCNIYLKTINSKTIPIAISVKEDFMQKVEYSLRQFLQIENVERKKYLINV